jgi:hypothetical protein
MPPSDAIYAQRAGRLPFVVNSTGQRSAKGRERCRLEWWRHDFYAKLAVAERRRMRAMIAESMKFMKTLRARKAACIRGHLDDNPMSRINLSVDDDMST